MENLFLNYMSRRLDQNLSSNTNHGPVITISREYGCQGTTVADMLTQKINAQLVKHGKSPVWRWVSKEILQKASEELQMNPGQIEQHLHSKEKNFLQDIVSSFTESDHVNNGYIRKVIHDVILNLALEGHVIIVGRAGGTIAWNLPKALHINLEAPLIWKSEAVAKKEGLSSDEAKHKVLSNDQHRSHFKDHFSSKGSDELYYHLSYNCKMLSNEQICESIIHTAEIKKLI